MVSWLSHSHLAADCCFSSCSRASRINSTDSKQQSALYSTARTISSTLCKLQLCNAGFSLHMMIACVVCIFYCVTQQSTEPIADANGQGDAPASTVSDSTTSAKDNDATTDENEEEDWFNMALATPSLTAFSNGKITPAVAAQLSQRSTATTAANTSATSAAASKANKSSGQLFSVLGAAAAARKRLVKGKRKQRRRNSQGPLTERLCKDSDQPTQQELAVIRLLEHARSEAERIKQLDTLYSNEDDYEEDASYYQDEQQ
jgi:hypothetical protein